MDAAGEIGLDYLNRQPRAENKRVDEVDFGGSCR
mgnify:CR=1 FL=1|jgi:hypothetical protein